MHKCLDILKHVELGALKDICCDVFISEKCMNVTSVQA